MSARLYYDMIIRRIPTAAYLAPKSPADPDGEQEVYGYDASPLTAAEVVALHEQTDGDESPLWLAVEDNGADGDGVRVRVLCDLPETRWPGEREVAEIRLTVEQARVLAEALQSVVKMRATEDKP